MPVPGLHRRADASSQPARQQTLMQQVYGFNDVTRVFAPDAKPALTSSSYYGLEPDPGAPGEPDRPAPTGRMRWLRRAGSPRAVRSRRLRTRHRRLIELMAADDRDGFLGVFDQPSGGRLDRPFLVYVSTFAGIALASVNRRRMDRIEQTNFLRAVAADERFFGELCPPAVVEFVVRSLSGAQPANLDPAPDAEQLILAALVVTAVALTPVGLTEPHDALPLERLEEIAMRSLWRRRVARHVAAGSRLTLRIRPDTYARAAQEECVNLAQ